VDPEERLRNLGLTLPAPPPPLAHYALVVRADRLLFLAGHAPLWDGQFQFVGKVGREWTVEQGYQAARLTGLNMLATVKDRLGDLDRVRRVVSLLGMVNCTEDFTRLHEVIDGASDLFVDLWGEAGLSARSTAGMQQLHFGMAIEIEGILEIVE
jgi:enamine deaminase RidA (YjgF/YER057c/UK114 family)